MKNKWINFKLKLWHFVFVLFGFIILINVIGRVKLETMSAIDSNSSLIELNETLTVNKPTSKISFVFFYSENSENCRKMEYNLDLLAKHDDGKANFYKIKIDPNSDIHSKYNISGTPNTLILNDNKEIDRIMGIVPYSNLEMIYNRVIEE